jgi:hypothetical protein
MGVEGLTKTIITTYEPDNSLKKGYLAIFGEIFNELKKNRWLTYQLFKRDFLTIYKQSYGHLSYHLSVLALLLC